MGSSPKQADYRPSAAEQASASVALAEYRSFKKKYDPLLQQMRDQSKTDDVSKTLRGRANADTMQALTKNTSYQNTQANDISSDMAKAYQGQLGIANRSGKDIQNKMQTSVLGTAGVKQLMRRQVWHKRHGSAHPKHLLELKRNKKFVRQKLKRLGK